MTETNVDIEVIHRIKRQRGGRTCILIGNTMSETFLDLQSDRYKTWMTERSSIDIHNLCFSTRI